MFVLCCMYSVIYIFYYVTFKQMPLFCKTAATLFYKSAAATLYNIMQDLFQTSTTNVGFVVRTAENKYTNFAMM